MKVLTLTQPWASLVALGEKQIETRSWNTSYRGPLAIHAAKAFPSDARALMHIEPFRSCLWPNPDPDLPPLEILPTGCIIAVCLLVDCRRMKEGTHCDVRHVNDFEIGSISGLSAKERAFGCYEDGRFAWTLSSTQKLTWPIPAKGSLGLWEFNMTPEFLDR